MKHFFLFIFLVPFLAGCTSSTDISPQAIPPSIPQSLSTIKTSTHYEVTFPILLDATLIPYNRVSQDGQTWFGINSVGWNTFGTKYETAKGLEGIPDVDSEHRLKKPLSVDYLCISPKKEGKSLAMESLFRQGYPLSDEPQDLTAVPLSDGRVGQNLERLALISEKNIKRLGGFVCAMAPSGWPEYQDTSVNFDISYRLQYPVGTKILFYSVITGKQEYTITSNYLSAAGNTSQEKLRVADALDICMGRTTCSTLSIVAVSLTGERRDITKAVHEYRKNSTSEEFFVPTDTALLEFQFEKKGNSVSGEYLF